VGTAVVAVVLSCWCDLVGSHFVLVVDRGMYLPGRGVAEEIHDDNCSVLLPHGQRCACVALTYWVGFRWACY